MHYFGFHLVSIFCFYSFFLTPPSQTLLPPSTFNFLLQHPFSYHPSPSCTAYDVGKLITRIESAGNNSQGWIGF